MALLVAQSIVEAGIVPTYSAVSSSDTFVNSESTFIEVVNGGSVTVTVTVDAKTVCNLGFDHNNSVAVAAAATKKIMIGKTWLYSDSSGIATVTFSATASITVGVFKI